MSDRISSVSETMKINVSNSTLVNRLSEAVYERTTNYLEENRNIGMEEQMKIQNKALNDHDEEYGLTPKVNVYA